MYYIMLFRNLTRIHKLLSIEGGDLLFIIPTLYPILSILTLLAHQALLAGLLGIIGNVDSYSIVLNLTQSFSINIRMREYPSNIVVKDIKGTPLLRLRLLKL